MNAEKFCEQTPEVFNINYTGRSVLFFTAVNAMKAEKFCEQTPEVFNINYTGRSVLFSTAVNAKHTKIS